ncbi:MAG: hypothetical protein IKN43_11100 [Selenomonadaceae bacterium]|nr:hypothetical protein [Selenomonadaceae bacterium]
MSSTGMLGAVNWGSSLFQRTNREIIQNGQSMTATISKQDNSFVDVSNFGTETKIGNSRFARGNARIYRDGTHFTEKLSSKSRTTSDVLKMGSGIFSDVTKRIFSDGSGGMKKGADSIRSYVDTLNYRTQNGSSKFQKANEFVSLKTLQNA